mmetsp:Transcript_41871/g.129408  ORF Transcript_41871/g.129408 Transcript_41871/m.129408 type:complete len:216 (+) Transcript_41871:621-1268(+)
MGRPGVLHVQLRAVPEGLLAGDRRPGGKHHPVRPVRPGRAGARQRHHVDHVVERAAGRYQLLHQQPQLVQLPLLLRLHRDEPVRDVRQDDLHDGAWLSHSERRRVRLAGGRGVPAHERQLHARRHPAGARYDRRRPECQRVRWPSRLDRRHAVHPGLDGQVAMARVVSVEGRGAQVVHRTDEAKRRGVRATVQELRVLANQPGRPHGPSGSTVGG